MITCMMIMVIVIVKMLNMVGGGIDHEMTVGLLMLVMTVVVLIVLIEALVI